jgi:hypothetical protein
MAFGERGRALFHVKCCCAGKKKKPLSAPKWGLSGWVRLGYVDDGRIALVGCSSLRLYQRCYTVSIGRSPSTDLGDFFRPFNGAWLVQTAVKCIRHGCIERHQAALKPEALPTRARDLGSGL